MQIDKLVQLLESPVFVHLRLQLLDVESPHHAPLLKSCYGLLMLLPQSDAFRSLNDRLTTVCNLRDNLGIPPTNLSMNGKSRLGLLSKRQNDLLAHFDKIVELHRNMQGREMQQLHDGRGGRNNGNNSSIVSATKVSISRVSANNSGSTPAPVFYAGGSEQGSAPSPSRSTRVTQEV